MKKTKLIPFDLERWKKGDFKRVMDGCSNEIKQITYFEGVADKRPLRGVRLCAIESWTIEGYWFDEAHAWDLFLEVEDTILQGWVNVYKDKLDIHIYPSKEEAIMLSENSLNYVTTIHITYNDNDR
jgi:hypothetical protein